MKSQKHRSLDAPEAPTPGTVLLRKTVSDSTLSKTVPEVPMNDVIMEEPTVETFLSLSDDDIADGPPITPPATPPSRQSCPTRLGSGCAPTFDLPPDPPVFQMPSPRSGSKRYSPLICLSSPLTSRPAKVAAFECQRIAQRFNFDLIYIVNLWPEHLAHPSQPSSSSIPAPGHSLGSPRRASRSSSNRNNNNNNTPPRSPSSRPAPHHHSIPLKGRLLAGHGLANLQTPFMISSAAHTKILRQDGWVEWRDESPSPDHFSRGYSRAFYAGVSPEPSCPKSPPSDANLNNNNNNNKSNNSNNAIPSLSEKRRSQNQQSRYNNRGIVFAAYRLPRADGAAVGADRAQLEALYGEAETLVEMLLDIHKTERSRRPGADVDADADAGAGGRRVGVDETGPLPVRPRFEGHLA
ncbi:hypothetical protein NKR19_g1086 [Coniochaeta hoffmannii]|uniref:Uncharacterized protein n=1 Tax=Coniochaeta hoffmannii TaxID=91930 RepID=A0AA38VTF6_9PEZI|nr:hypothetical protein NKR19_g1086 [Coniochaeta hoffmannii]